MNYLAHIYLSGEDDEIKIGNFIADSVKGKKFIGFSKGIRDGIILHRAIDTYTDVHPVFRKSVQKLFPVYSHYSTVIIDIFYDHFLAVNWSQYSTSPLDIYVDNFYDLLNEYYQILPKRVQHFLPYMIEDNWLASYATIDGIEKILIQMNRRTKYRSKMDKSVKELQLYYPEFDEEFKIFFGDLQQYVARRNWESI